MISVGEDLRRLIYLSYYPDIWDNPTPESYHYFSSIVPQVPMPPLSGMITVSDPFVIIIMNSHWKKTFRSIWQMELRETASFC
jgi:hypothetical protein